MPKRPTSKITEQSGVNFVAEVVNVGRCIFNKIDTGNDVGIDAYVEVIQSGTTTGCCIGVQIKSGQSYLNRVGDHFAVHTDKGHLQYWFDHILPIAIIVFDPYATCGYWCDVTDYIKKHPECLAEGPYVIQIPVVQTFTKDDYSRFVEHFLPYSKLRSSDINLVKALNALLDSGTTFEPQLSAIKSLFYFHRHEKSTWFFFVNLVRLTDDRQLLHALIFFLRHVADHGDIWWTEWNMVPSEIEFYAAFLIDSCFAENEVAKLLSFVDEEGFDRGTFGQNVAAIIGRIMPTNRQRVLRVVAFDSKNTPQVRYWAILLLAYDLQSKSFEDALATMKEYVKRFPTDAANWPLADILESLEDGTGFGIM